MTQSELDTDVSIVGELNVGILYTSVLCYTFLSYTLVSLFGRVRATANQLKRQAVFIAGGLRCRRSMRDLRFGFQDHVTSLEDRKWPAERGELHTRCEPHP